MIKTGVNVPYSAEFRDRETNRGLLESLALFTPRGGQPGKLIDGELHEAGFQQLLKVNTYRDTLAKPRSSQPAWPLVIAIAAVVFFADVFVRRVAVQFGWLSTSLVWLKHKVFRQEVEVVEDARIERLRSKKAAISQQLEERRASIRFEPLIDSDDSTTGDSEGTEILDDVARERPGSSPSPPPETTAMSPGEVEEESYTDRLLQAKRKALKPKDREH